MKIICILFHVGKKKNEITRDSQLRLLAGAELAKENRETLVLFVGGSGLPISGAELLKRFWVKNFPEIKNSYFILNSSNNTFNNLREIVDFVEKRNISLPDVKIISNLYHKDRLRRIANEFDLKMTVPAAENILIERNRQKNEIKKYLNSIEYKRKSLLELFLRIYLLIDPEQKIIKLWRLLVYTRKK